MSRRTGRKRKFNDFQEAYLANPKTLKEMLPLSLKERCALIERKFDMELVSA